jgi:menaquinone-dependent protoporphyrinogen IX oxidase
MNFVERLQDILKTEPEDIIKVRNLLDKAKEENKRLREEIKNLEKIIEMTNCEVCTGYLITKKVLRQYRI